MFLAGYPTHRQVHSRPVVVVAVVVVVIGRRRGGGGGRGLGRLSPCQTTTVAAAANDSAESPPW